MIAASLPAIVAILSRPFLKEECGLFQTIALTLTLVGVFIVMKPPFVYQHLGLTQVKKTYTILYNFSKILLYYFLYVFIFCTLGFGGAC